MKKITRRSAIAKTVALSAVAAPAAALAGTEKQAPEIGRTMWHSRWFGDQKVFTEIAIVPDRAAYDGLVREHPHMADWHVIPIGTQLLVMEPRESSLKRIDTEDVHRRHVEACVGRKAAREAGDVEAERRHDADLKAILHC
jgi:hypothetical protein